MSTWTHAMCDACWNKRRPLPPTTIAAGWIIQDLGYLQVLNEPDVEIVERP